MDKVVKVVLFLFVGALIVLVVTHAQGFASATSAVGGQVTNDAYLLTGAAAPASVSVGGVTATTSGGAPGSWAKAA